MHACAIHRQGGAALVVALLVAALVAVFATSVGYQYLLSARRAGNVLLGDQAYFYLLSAEKLASALLKADPTLEYDSEEELKQTALQFPIDGGIIQGYLVDAQSKFNINNVVQRNQPQNDDQNPGQTPIGGANWETAFISFLSGFENLELERFQAEEIVNAMKDWIDADDNLQQEGGSEADYYANLDVPYRPANQEFQHISELQLVRGITPEIYTTIKPYIAALEGEVLVNINTVLPQVVRSLGESQSQLLSEVEVEAVLADKQNPEAEIAGRPGAQPLRQQFLARKSDYFEFEGSVMLGPVSMPMRSLLRREEGGSDGAFTVSVIHRSLNTL